MQFHFIFHRVDLRPRSVSSADEAANKWQQSGGARSRCRLHPSQSRRRLARSRAGRRQRTEPGSRGCRLCSYRGCACVGDLRGGTRDVIGSGGWPKWAHIHLPGFSPISSPKHPTLMAQELPLDPSVRNDITPTTMRRFPHGLHFLSRWDGPARPGLTLTISSRQCATPAVMNVSQTPPSPSPGGMHR